MYIFLNALNNSWLLRVWGKKLLKTLSEKEKFLKQFFLLPQSFLPVWRTFHHIHEIQNCRL